MKKISRKTIAVAGLILIGMPVAVFFTNCSEKGFEAASARQQGFEDPLLSMAWHIRNIGDPAFSKDGGEPGNDLNLLNAWTDGLTGSGITILISDDGIENTHEDLKRNYLSGGFSKDYTLSSPYYNDISPPKTDDDNHGTSVAGLIAAVAENGVGTKGVAPKAKIVSANFLTSAVIPGEAQLVDQAKGDYDIFNMSWGSPQNNLSDSIEPFKTQLRFGVLNNRSGKGSIYVKSAGNDFFVLCNGSEKTYCVGNSNFDSDNNTPYTVLTTALNARGLAASYSSGGANVWISSFGGEFGMDSPAMITTDRSGCAKGVASSSTKGELEFERGAYGNQYCNYTAAFNGTSAAAPVLSGAIALLLESNPNLSWRDVKYILAKTATPVNFKTTGSIAHPDPYVTVPSGYAWEQAWVTNSAGFNFHNWYGFGRVNVDGAVQYAKNYTSSFGALTQTNWIHDRAGLSLIVPDNSAVGVSDSVTVNDSLKIEAVQLRIWITHPDISEIALELTSPARTKSIVINLNNSLQNISDYLGEVFLSNAFYQESSKGTWTLKVIDGKSGETGTVTHWSLNFFGSN